MGNLDDKRRALCDGCGEYADLDSPEVHAVMVEDCMPIVLCGPCCRRVVWTWLERQAS